MKLHRWAVGMMAAAVTAGVASAEPMRTVLSMENRLPDRKETEVGLSLNMRQYKDAAQDYMENDVDMKELVASVSYGVTRDFSLDLRVPGVSTSLGDADEETGVGDVSLGFRLRAFEEPYGYPYVIPHAAVTFPTGDEENGQGAGELGAWAGVAVGDQIWDCLDLALDLSYRFQDEGYFTLSGHAAWALSEKFSVTLEARWQDDEDSVSNRNSHIWLGGMTYKPTDLWMVGVYAGTSLDGDEKDTLGGVRVAYTFD